MAHSKAKHRCFYPLFLESASTLWFLLETVIVVARNFDSRKRSERLSPMQTVTSQ